MRPGGKGVREMLMWGRENSENGREKTYNGIPSTVFPFKLEMILDDFRPLFEKLYRIQSHSRKT